MRPVDEPEPDDDGLVPSAYTFTLSDEDPDLDALTLAFVEAFAEDNPDLRLESVTFRRVVDPEEIE